jgi:hypothetical protein
MTREAALHALLGELFSPDELRIHLALGQDGDQIVAAIPQGVPAAVAIEAAISALRRRGMLGRVFFERLATARPHRHSEILRVSTLWSGDSADEPPDDAAPPATLTHAEGSAPHPAPRAPASLRESTADPPVDRRPPVAPVGRPRTLLWVTGVLLATMLAIAAMYLAAGGPQDSSSSPNYLAGLPALLGVVGVSIYLLVVRRHEPQTILGIMDSIAQRTRHLPQIDQRLSSEKIHALLATNPEFRAAISAQDERIILEHLRRRHIGETAALFVSCTLIALPRMWQ